MEYSAIIVTSPWAVSPTRVLTGRDVAQLRGKSQTQLAIGQRSPINKVYNIRSTEYIP